MRHKFAICLFTVLGCVVLISGNEIPFNGWIRQKREGNTTPNRRQSTGDGLFSFKIPVLPVLRDLGIVPPRAEAVPEAEPDPSHFTNYLLRTAASRIGFARNYVLPRVIKGFIKVGNKVANDVENFKRTAEPVVASSAAAWRRTVDEEISPAVVSGLTKVGEVTVNGLAQGADKLAEVVMGEEAKEETKVALSSLSRAFWQEENNETEINSNGGYSSNLHDYDQQYYNQYPPGQTQNLDFSESPNPYAGDSMLVSDSSNRQYSNRIYKNNNPVSVSDNFVSSSFSFATEEPLYSDFQPRNDPDTGSVSYTNALNHDNQYYDSSYSYPYDQYQDSSYYKNEPNQRYGPYNSFRVNPNEPIMTVEEALYVLGKNIFGRNVTDRIFPVAKQLAFGLGQVGEGISTISDAFPPLPNLVEFDGTSLSLHSGNIAQETNAKSDEFRGERNADAQYNSPNQVNDGRITRTGAPRCTTPEGGGGRCVDIQDCPILLVNFDNLRKSICFKALFVPGVCCPNKGVELVNLGSQGVDIKDVVPSIDQEESRPSINEIESSINSFPNLLPQGTTSARPIGPELPPSPQQLTPIDKLPSLSNLPTTTPPSSSFLNDPPGFVPGTNIGCGETKIPQARIVGGNETFEGEYPWMVAIYLHGNGKSEFWCGGALVSRNHIITAAHCTKDSKKRPFRPSQFTVKLGEWDLKDSDIYSQEFRIVEITAHPDFKANGFYNDVAVFKLDQPAYFNEYIQPICLPNAAMTSRSFIGERPVALGWGSTHYGGSEVGTLRGVDLPVWSQRECDDAYFQPITEVFLCAGYHKGGRDACQGDSGGPLMLYDNETHKWTLIGVISFGNRCAEAGYPGVFTRITHFMPWIYAHMT